MECRRTAPSRRKEQDNVKRLNVRRRKASSSSAVPKKKIGASNSREEAKSPSERDET